MSAKIATQDRQTAYEMYLQGYTPQEIASKTGLNKYTVRKWVTDGNWKEDRDELQAELQQNYKIQLRQTMMDNRIKTMQDHMKLGENLEKLVHKTIMDDEGDFKQLGAKAVMEVCRGAKSAADIRARAVGMTDRVDPLADEVKNSNIIINVGMKAKAAPAEQDDIPHAEVNMVVDGVEIPFG